MNEYDQCDKEEDIGYNRFLLQQLKSNQHAEKNNSLSWHQTQHSLPCSYQTLNYSAYNSWKPQTRHFASSPLSLEEIKSKKSTVAVNSNSVNFSASSSFQRIHCQTVIHHLHTHLHLLKTVKQKKGKERNCRGEELD